MDDTIDKWLRDEVVPVFDRVMNRQEKLVPAEEVFSGIESRYYARKSQKKLM